MTIPALPVKTWSTIGRAFTTYGQQWPVLFGLAVMSSPMNLVAQLWQRQAAAPGAAPSQNWLLLSLLYLGGSALSSWGLLATWIAADRLLQGAPASFVENLRAVRGKFWRFIGVTLLFGLLVTGIMTVGFLPLGILAGLRGGAAQPNTSPATAIAIVAELTALAAQLIVLYLAIRLSLYSIVIAVEPRGSSGPLRRSRALTRGAFWRTVGLYVAMGLCFLPAWVPMMLAMNLQDQTIRSWPLYAVGQLIGLVLSPAALVAIVIWYHALKAEKEGATSSTTA